MKRTSVRSPKEITDSKAASLLFDIEDTHFGSTTFKPIFVECPNGVRTYKELKDGVKGEFPALFEQLLQAIKGSGQDTLVSFDISRHLKDEGENLRQHPNMTYSLETVLGFYEKVRIRLNDDDRVYVWKGIFAEFPCLFGQLNPTIKIAPENAVLKLAITQDIQTEVEILRKKPHMLARLQTALGRGKALVIAPNHTKIFVGLGKGTEKAFLLAATVDIHIHPTEQKAEPSVPAEELVVG